MDINMCNKEEVILRLLESLNVRNSCMYDDRLHQAIYQYEQLVKQVIINKIERT